MQKKFTIDDYRNYLIRYPDRLTMVFSSIMGKALDRVIHYSSKPDKMLGDNDVLMGLACGMASLMECGIIDHGRAGRLMCYIKELGGDAYIPVLTVVGQGLITAWYGTPDGKGGCTINKEGARVFRSLIDWEGKELGFRKDKKLTEILPKLFKDRIDETVEMCEKKVPDIEIRYPVTDGDRIASKGGDVAEELKFILDCPAIAVPYYDICIKHTDERIEKCAVPLRKSKDGESELLTNALRVFRELYEGFREIAEKYAEGEYASLDDVSAAFYNHEDMIDKKYPEYAKGK